MNRRVLRRVAMVHFWMALGLLAGLAVALVVPVLLGGRSFTVVSGSMEPALHVGEVVIDRQISSLEARVGDIVTFQAPDGSGHLITHRVRSIRPVGSEVVFVTKGDANNSVEHWSVPANGEIGRVAYRLPWIGYVLVWIGGRYGRLVLIALPALMLGGIRVAPPVAPPAERGGSAR